MSPQIDPNEPFPGQEPAEAGRQASSSETRRSNPIYELFVLGELMSSPTYGYKLNEILNRIIGPHQQLSWGTLYPLFRRLEREGLITASVEKRATDFPTHERGQPRRIYAITPAGRERFFTLMQQPQSHSYHPDLFAVQLTKFEYLTPEQRLLILQGYHKSQQALQLFYQRMRAHMQRRKEIREAELPFILQLIDYRLHMLSAELAWFERAITQAREKQVEAQDKTQE
ncbi:PadR family transcriptional regulator [Ktedonosporobacter rubrisoli]|uniref:PadR family transcriptional regulator n=1 Tax=Ktedonosporobacter rubrisoli TaxID=2509675 RepID=A0A4P6JU52_KTERU|nr:PadR family transcriptional regulator [Ktedonosporobacter rubrisoli]QBD78840.1 PadR family transcriptional regulator [Ktedonosporobacter rubrisoli]